MRHSRLLRYPTLTGHFALLSAFIGGLAAGASAHVDEGQGSGLQLYSYRLTGTTPVIDGSILSRNGDPGTKDTPGEWSEAYTREVELDDGSIATLFLMNDDDSLYVAVIYEHGNNGDGAGVRLYFDEGASGGGHDDALTAGAARNEDGYGVIRAGSVADLSDVSWNGSAWSDDGDGELDFRGERHFFNDAFKVHMQEFAIPLKNPKADNADNSDLNISLNDELGFFIQVEKRGSGAGTFHWMETNGNVNNPQAGVGWADLKLNVSRRFNTFFATVNANGNPAVDGDLGDDAWRGSYRRNIVLTNFKGAALPAVFRAVQDHATGIVYVALEIELADAGAADFAQIYLEENASDGTTAERNYILESGGEDATRATGGTLTDLYWNGAAWASDTELGLGDAHDASGSHAGGRYRYEFAIPYVDVVAGQDANMPDNGAPGLFILFHDDSRPAGERRFYWEFAGNTDAVNVDPNSTTRLAAGWPLFQFGAPYAQVIFPEDGGAVQGVVHTRVQAQDEDGIAGVDSVVFYRAADTASRFRMTRITGTGEWGGSWSVGSIPDGTDTLVFRVHDNDGLFVERLVELTVDNGGTPQPPSIALTAPAPGSVLSGDTVVTFAAAGGAGTVERTYIIIDGADTARTTTPSTHNLSTLGLADGSHTVRLQAYNSNGALAETPVTVYHVRNAPSAVITNPGGGDTIGSVMALEYVSTPARSTAILSDSLFIDGSARGELNSGQPNPIDVGSLAEGTHILRIKTTATGGRTAWSEEVAVHVRNGPSIGWSPGFADSAVSGEVVLRFSAAAAAPAGIARVEISLDGGDYGPASTDSSHVLDTRPLAEGPHVARLRVVDTNGKSALSETLKFVVRNRPSVTILEPAVDALARDTAVIRFRARAVAPDTVAFVEISVGGGDWLAVPGDSLHPLATREFRDGDLRFQLRVTDGAGKRDTSLTREIVVDNSPPKLSFPEVRFGGGEGARQGGRAILTAQALDFLAGMDADSGMVLTASEFAGDLPVVLRDDGEEPDAVAGDNVFSAWFDIVSDSNGAASFSLRARDALGNDTVLQSSLVLDNRPPRADMTLEPAPVDGENALSGKVYVPRLIVKGSFSDSAGSGLGAGILSTENDSGLHVNDSPLDLPLSQGTFSRVLRLVPGTNRITLTVRDRAGNATVRGAMVEYLSPKVTLLATREAGRLQSPDGSRLDIPEGALHGPREITMRRADPQAQPAARDARLRLLGVPRELGPDGLVFRLPVTLTLTYTAADLDTNQDGTADFDAQRLAIVYWNGGDWISAGDPARNPGARSISVSVNHFTLFDIAEDSRPSASELVAYWSENPVRGRSDFVYRVPEPGRVSLHILDMAGDMVRELIRPGTPVSASGSVQWDGSQVAGRFAGAGLYIYVFKYAPDDGGTERLIRKPLGLARERD